MAVRIHHYRYTSRFRERPRWVCQTTWRGTVHIAQPFPRNLGAASVASMGLLDRLKSLVRGSSHDPLAPTVYDDGSVFDPRLVQAFAAEVMTWPKDQARTALLIVRGVLSGKGSEVRPLLDELTVGQMRIVMDYIEKVDELRRKK